MREINNINASSNNIDNVLKVLSDMTTQLNTWESRHPEYTHTTEIFLTEKGFTLNIKTYAVVTYQKDY